MGRQRLEFGALDPDEREEARAEMLTFFIGQTAAKRAEPVDDIISQLLQLRVERELVEMTHILGTVAIEEWFERAPSFRLEDPAAVTWSRRHARPAEPPGAVRLTLPTGPSRSANSATGWWIPRDCDVKACRVQGAR